MDRVEAPPYSPHSLYHRRANPDVPEDVDTDVKEALLHLNDPNWDFGSSETSSLSGDSFELDHKHKYADDVHIGPSLGPSEFDTESRTDSTSAYGGKSDRMHLRSSEVFDEYEE